VPGALLFGFCYRIVIRRRQVTPPALEYYPAPYERPPIMSARYGA